MAKKKKEKRRGIVEEKNRGREKNIERGRPIGRKHLRGKTRGKRVVSTQREVPKKRENTQVRKITHDKIVVRN